MFQYPPPQRATFHLTPSLRRWRDHAVLVLVLLAGCTSGPDVATTRAEAIALGDALVAKQQYADAAEAYQRAVEADPRDVALRMKLSTAAEAAGNYALAAAQAIRAADLLPDRIDVQLRAAAMLSVQARFTEVTDRTSTILERDPDNVEALILYANAKAQLLNSNWAFYKLTDARTMAEFEEIRFDLRPRVSRADDAAAEAAFRKAVTLAPALMEARVALANFFWAVGRLDEGETALRVIADANPGHAAWNHALGRLCLLRGNAADGERYLKNAAATGVYGKGAQLALADHYMQTNRPADVLSLLGPSSADDDAAGEVSLRLAAAEFQLGRRQDAMQRVEKRVARLPRDGGALLLKAQFLFQLQQPEALRFAREAVTASPSSAEARLLLGRLLFATGDVENAANEYLEAGRLNPASAPTQVELARVSLARGRDKEALTFAREGVRLLPGDADAQVLLVKALIRAEDYSAAEQELKRLLAREPSSPDGLIQLGTVHAARANAAAARAALTRALQLAPNSLDGVSALVSLELDARQFVAARQLVQRALVAHGRDPAYLVLAARVYDAEKDTARAESALRQALQLDSTNAAAVLALADLLSRQGRQEDAVRLLQQFTDARPQAIAVQTSLAGLLEKAGRTAEAEARYEKIIAQDPTATVASLRLATIWLNRGDLDRALALATALQQLAPDDAGASDLLGSIYMRRNVPWSAVRQFERAVSLNPGDPLYRFHLGSAYREVRQGTKSRQELTRALELDPDFVHAADARTLLGIKPK